MLMPRTSGVLHRETLSAAGCHGNPRETATLPRRTSDAVFETPARAAVARPVTATPDPGAIIAAVAAQARPAPAGFVDVWQFRLVAAPALAARCQAVLSDAETARAARFHTDLLQARYQLCHGMMRFILSAYTDLRPGDIRFDHGRGGKPALAAGLCPAGAIGFNLSHSGDLAMLAVSDRTAPGLDVEVIRDDIEAGDITSYYTAREAGWIAGLPPRARQRAVFCSWVRKEAYIKALGTGLQQPLNSFEIRRHPGNQPWCVAHNCAVGRSDPAWRIDDLSAPPGCVAAIARPQTPAPLSQQIALRQFALHFTVGAVAASPPTSNPIDPLCSKRPAGCLEHHRSC